MYTCELNALGGEPSRTLKARAMKRSPSPKAAPTKPIPVRLKVNEIARIEKEAAAAGLSRSGSLRQCFVTASHRHTPRLPFAGHAMRR